MPVVRVTLWSGRDKQQKADLAKAITEAFVDVASIPAEGVTIVMEEQPQENWATGGVLHSELIADKS